MRPPSTPDALMHRLFGTPDNPHTIIDVDLNGNPIQPDQETTPELDADPEPSRFSRYGRYSGRTALAGALLVASGAVVLHEEPVSAEDTQTVAESTVPRTVYRTGGDGVWLHESPGLTTPLKVVMPEGSQFNVDCFVTGGDSVNGNRLWLQGDYNGTPGAVTDYYISTKWNTTQDLVNQGIEECGTQPAAGSAPEQPQAEQAPQQRSCYFNMKWLKTDLTFSYEGEHRYYGNAWQAAKNWTDLNAGISIKPVEEIWQKPDIIFRDVNKPEYKWYGRTSVPETRDWMSSLTQPSSNPHSVDRIVIEVNQYPIENNPDEKYQLDDKGRTYMLTHELGHALGLAHPDATVERGGCEVDGNSIDSIMEAGKFDEPIKGKSFNTPQEYDRIALEALYDR